MTTYAYLEMEIVRWAENRGIVKNSTAMAQALKTLEEVQELLTAIHSNNKEQQIDAYADILVTLIVGCAVSDLNLIQCLEVGFNQIKNRTGKMNDAGIFVKDNPSVEIK